MVNETAPENSESPKGIFVASPSMTWTLLPFRRELSKPANVGSISSAMRRGTEVRRRSVVKPGPGPISKRLGLDRYCRLPRGVSVRRCCASGQNGIALMKAIHVPHEMVKVDLQRIDCPVVRASDKVTIDVAKAPKWNFRSGGRF
jgi:hypothetical protein